MLLCGFVVYSDFLIHPVSLLATSSKLRNEVVTTVMKFMTQAANHATKLLPLALCRYVFSTYTEYAAKAVSGDGTCGEGAGC